MVTSPSLVFYILQSGGTYKQYGITLAAFSFSSLFKPVLGLWCDKSGGKFRAPYLTSSISVAALGGFVYFMASQFQGKTAIALIFMGRF